MRLKPAVEAEAATKKESIFWRAIPLMLVIAVVSLTFVDVPHFDFVMWDDGTNLYKNHFYQPVTWTTFHRFWTRPYFDLYIPVTYSAWAGIAYLWHLPTPVPSPTAGVTTLLQASPFHVASVLCHLCNALLVYMLLRMVAAGSRGSQGICPRSDWNAAIGALLFAVHPIQTEAAAWISEFRGLLSAFFGLLALLGYLVFLTSSRSSGRWWKFGLAMAAYTLGFLSKPTVVVMPLMAAVLLLWMKNCLTIPWKQALAALVAWSGLGLGLILGTAGSQPEPSFLHLSVWDRLLVAADSTTFYLSKIVFPNDLGPDYGHTPVLALSDRWIAAKASLPILLAIVCWVYRRSRPSLWLGYGVLLAALAPVLGLRTFEFQATSTVADRYAYLAMLGPALLLAVEMRSLTAKPGYVRLVSTVSAGLLLSICALVTNVQSQYWRNTLSLGHRAIIVNPRTARFHDMLGLAEFAEHNDAAAAEQDRAALSLHPWETDAHNNYGLVLNDEGDLPGAVSEFEKAVKLRPNNAQAWNNLGNALAHTGNTIAAEAAYRNAIAANPQLSPVYENMGDIYARQRRFDQAIAMFQAAARLQPTSPAPWVKIGIVDLLARQPAAAEDEFRVALRIDPSNASAQQLLQSTLSDESSQPYGSHAGQAR